MMDESILRALVREEIEKALNVILHGATANATEDYFEDIEEMFPGMPTITKRPVMHPYGFASRAPAGIISVIARIGAHIGNRQVIGHRDKNRPQIGGGETVLYNESGQQIRLENGKIKVGSAGSANPAALGDKTNDITSEIIDAIVAHTHTETGVITSPPLNLPAFVVAKLKLTLKTNLSSKIVLE